ncbi:uncharacterized protein [Pleurodeles waltl]|uniref:uncharacterized protein n=1 Tax=Pleurodeles waltl TaxID=8319 RepID=UPI003709389B
MTPFLTPRTESERQYNSAHKRTRNLIERTFGLLKARFRCLHRSGGALQYTPITAFKIVVACAILHNIATRRGLPLTPADPDPDDEEQEQPHRHHGDRSLANQGRLRQDHIATQYFGRSQSHAFNMCNQSAACNEDDGSPVDLSVLDYPDDLDDHLTTISQETLQDVLGTLQTPTPVARRSSHVAAIPEDASTTPIEWTASSNTAEDSDDTGTTFERSVVGVQQELAKEVRVRMQTTAASLEVMRMCMMTSTEQSAAIQVT